MLGNDTRNKNGCDEVTMGGVRVRYWDGKVEVRGKSQVSMLLLVQLTGFESFGSQRKKGVAVM